MTLYKLCRNTSTRLITKFYIVFENIEKNFNISKSSLDKGNLYINRDSVASELKI